MIELERVRMQKVDLCGERVVERLESIGVTRLSQLAGRDPWNVMHEINLQAGRVIWRPPLAVMALQNLIAAAEQERLASARPEHAGG